MAVHRTHKQSDLEKRLKLLNQQLYGKKESLDVRDWKMDKEVRSSKLEDLTSNIQSRNPSSNLKHPTSSSDVLYLRHDLLKIAVLSALALAVELALYFGNITSRFKFF